MNQKTFSLIAGVIFSAVALLHLGRLVLGWEAVIGGWEVPLWFSAFALAGAGYLAYTGLRFGTPRRK